MSDYQKTVESVKEMAGELYGKAGRAKDIAVLTFQVKQRGMEIAKLCRKVGEIAYKKLAPLDGEADELYARIDELRSQIEALKEKISEVKSEKKCPRCGKSLPSGYRFCPVCGEKLDVSEPVPQEKEEKQD